LAFVSVFACGIAVTVFLVTLIRPVPKIGDFGFEIGAERNSDNQPVSPSPQRILFPDNGATHPLMSDNNQPITFGKRVVSVTLTLIDRVMYPNGENGYWGYVWALIDPKDSSRIQIHGQY
jgi:hypothetical protein